MCHTPHPTSVLPVCDLSTCGFCIAGETRMNVSSLRHYFDRVVLKVFRDPTAWGEERGITFPNWGAGSPSAVLEVALPELAGHRDFYDQIVYDLKQRGLMSNVDIHTSMTRHGMFQPRTTTLGSEFLRFIS
jgi:hypothetical protein